MAKTKNTKNTKNVETKTKSPKATSKKDKKETKVENLSFEDKIKQLFELAAEQLVCDSDDLETFQNDILEVFNEMQEKITTLEKSLKKAKKAKKAPKDKNAPKKNVSNWVHFCAENREKVKAENPDMKPKEIMKELSLMWKALDEDEKAEYEEKAKEDKERYLKEKETYVPVEGTAEAEKEKKTKKKKLPGEPKNAKSAWLFFCEAERKKLDKEKTKRSGKEKMAELSERWKKIKGTKKAKKYEELAAQDKVRHKEEMENWTPPEEVEVVEDSDSDDEDNEEQKPKEVEESDSEDEQKPKEVEESDLEIGRAHV